MDTLHTYFQSKAFELPKKRVTCYFSRYCHAGMQNVRLLSEELIPQELLRHPDYASLLQEGGFPAVNTSFNHPTEGFDAIAIDFCDPANQPYVLRFYLRTFRTYYMAQSGISAVRENGLNQTLAIYGDCLEGEPFRLYLAMRRNDPTRIFLTLRGPKRIDFRWPESLNRHGYGVPPWMKEDLNQKFQQEFLNYETLNQIVCLFITRSEFPGQEDTIRLRLDLRAICDLVNHRVSDMSEQLKHMRAMCEKEAELLQYQTKVIHHYAPKYKDELFFTQGLKMARTAVYQAIDLLIENGMDLLDQNERSIDWLFKDLCDLAWQVREQLAALDPRDQLWRDVRAQRDSCLMDSLNKTAQVVFLRNVLIEIARCWKELETHPVAKRRGRVGDTFLREIGGMWECDELYLEKIPVARKKPSYFKYAGDLDALINDIFPFLLEKEMIAKETKKQQLKLIFMGRETSVVIKWTGEKHLLTHLFKQLCDGKNPPLITHPNNRFKWTIVKRNFVDKDGKKLPDDIRSETERTKDGSKALIKLIVDAFRKNLTPKQKGSV